MKNILIKLISIILAFTLSTFMFMPTALTMLTPVSGDKALNNVYADDYTGNTSAVFVEGLKFDDVPQYWATEYIYWGVRKGIINGYEDKTFRPNLQITEAEFASVLAKYVTNINVSKLTKVEGKHWAQHIYDALADYQLPFKGYNDDEVKDTGLTRGRIAQIIAAKNGFNLTERQAIYYMYENDISNGLIPGELSFESYGADKPVLREQIPGFFCRLNSLGVTTFMGKPSPVENPDVMVGIADVPPSDVEITDEMFTELGKEKGIIDEQEGELGTLSNPIVINNTEVVMDNSAYWDVIRKNPELGDKLVAKINGIVTPVDPWKTAGYVDHPSGLVLYTCMSPSIDNGGFKDKDLFIKIVQEYWTDLLDENQINKIVEVINEYYDIRGKDSGRIKMKGEKYDIMIYGRLGIEVSIYEKGHVIFDD